MVHDGSGTVYVADSGNNRIRKIYEGTVTTLTGGTAGDHRDGPLHLARFNKPMGVAMDKKYIYVADEMNHVIRVLRP